MEDRSKKTDSIRTRIVRTVFLGLLFGMISAIAFYGTGLAIRSFPVASSPAEEYDSEPANIPSLWKGNYTVAEVAKMALPCVVAITSVSIQEIPDFYTFGFSFGYRDYASTGSGSGIIVGENERELFIATNYHVIEDASSLHVCFIGDDVAAAEKTAAQAVNGVVDQELEGIVTATVKGTDPENDLAVLAVKKEEIPVETRQEIQVAVIGNSDEMVVGEQVVAIGNALGYGQTVTSGWVSALDRSVSFPNGMGEGLIQTDTAINPGNSGGALLNMRGEVIGINSAKYASSFVEGTGFAIPISRAVPILEELMERKTRERIEDKSRQGYLGVFPADISREVSFFYGISEGALVRGVEEGSPAEQAGLCGGDIIIELDGQRINSRKDLTDRLEYYEAGEKVKIRIYRFYQGRYRDGYIEALLGNRPAKEEKTA